MRLGISEGGLLMSELYETEMVCAQRGEYDLIIIMACYDMMSTIWRSTSVALVFWSSAFYNGMERKERKTMAFIRLISYGMA